MSEPRYCWAGRRAALGGRWTTPCPRVRPEEPSEERWHLIGAPGLPEPIELCDEHFQEAFALGLVTQPNISREGFDHLYGGATQPLTGEPSKAWIVGEWGSQVVLGEFDSEQEAAEFISTLPGHLDGRYYLDPPEEE